MSSSANDACNGVSNEAHDDSTLELRRPSEQICDQCINEHAGGDHHRTWRQLCGAQVVNPCCRVCGGKTQSLYFVKNNAEEEAAPSGGNAAASLEERAVTTEENDEDERYLVIHSPWYDTVWT